MDQQEKIYVRDQYWRISVSRSNVTTGFPPITVHRLSPYAKEIGQTRMTQNGDIYVLSNCTVTCTMILK